MFPTNDIMLGPRSYGARAFPTEGIVWHTTESKGTGRDAAVAVAKMQSPGGSLYAGGGSYNWIIYDGGLLLTVPYLEASGGMGVNSTAWAPERHAFLRESLSASAYRDPNKYLLNVAFAGQAGMFAQGIIPDNMLDNAARLALWVEEQEWSVNKLLHSGHLHWQTNRSDPSHFVLNEIQKRITKMSTPDENLPYVDISDSSFKAQIKRMTERGIFTVPQDKLFHPKDTVTREQLAVVVDRIFREEDNRG